MRYQLWQRVKEMPYHCDPCDRNATRMNEDANELVWSWRFWTLEEALAWAEVVKHELKGCFGEYATYYQIYDACTYEYYKGEGFDARSWQERQNALDTASRH